MNKDLFKNPDEQNLLEESVLVIDADWLAFKIASVLETKSVQVYDGDVFIKKFKNRTEFKKSALFDPSFEVKDCQVLKKNYQDTMVYLIQDLVKRYLNRTGCEKAVMALGGKLNFRNDLPLIQKYKGNRDGLMKPLSLYEVRDKLSEMYETLFSEDEEADDILSKFQFLSTQKKKQRIVVCTLDKDARGTPGILFNPDKDTIVTIEGLGFLELVKGSKTYKMYGEGRKWFYYQLIHGDSADHYYPCDLYKKLIGNTSKSPIMTDLKCFNLLSHCKTDAECLEAIANLFRDWYKDINQWVDWSGKTVEGSWLDLLQCYVDVVHMRRWDNDRVDIKILLKKFGLLDDLEI